MLRQRSRVRELGLGLEAVLVWLAGHWEGLPELGRGLPLVH